MKGSYYGKYRGVVINNVDPMQMGRIQASVPDVGAAIPTTWALPCVPITGKGAGTWFVPPIGTGVWIEFEQGDPEYPIWAGCFWGSASETPSDAKKGNPVSPSIVLETGLKNLIVISDLPGPKGGIMLKSMSGAQILINDTGITIKNGLGAQIVLKGPSVDINNGALKVV